MKLTIDRNLIDELRKKYRNLSEKELHLSVGEAVVRACDKLCLLKDNEQISINYYIETFARIDSCNNMMKEGHND